jgi:SAM-dependent methyltransferase
MPDKSEKVKKTLSGIADLYTSNLEDHGVDSKSVGWKTEESQILRFDKQVQVIDMTDGQKSISINDLGVGYGAFFSYLDNLEGVQISQFYGYDISPEMLQKASELISDPRLKLIENERITEQADYSFQSGIFNVKLEMEDDDWTKYVEDVLLNMAEMSRKGFAFNVLTKYVDWKQEDLFYADPLYFFDFCKTKISRYVSLIHDYPLYEWTMLVKMEE